MQYLSIEELVSRLKSMNRTETIDIEAPLKSSLVAPERVKEHNNQTIEEKTLDNVFNSNEYTIYKGRTASQRALNEETVRVYEWIG